MRVGAGLCSALAPPRRRCGTTRRGSRAHPSPPHRRRQPSATPRRGCPSAPPQFGRGRWGGARGELKPSVVLACPCSCCCCCCCALARSASAAGPAAGLPCTTVLHSALRQGSPGSPTHSGGQTASPHRSAAPSLRHCVASVASAAPGLPPLLRGVGGSDSCSHSDSEAAPGPRARLRYPALLRPSASRRAASQCCTAPTHSS